MVNLVNSRGVSRDQFYLLYLLPVLPFLLVKLVKLVKLVNLVNSRGVSRDQFYLLYLFYHFYLLLAPLLPALPILAAVGRTFKEPLADHMVSAWSADSHLRLMASCAMVVVPHPALLRSCGASSLRSRGLLRRSRHEGIL